MKIPSCSSNSGHSRTPWLPLSIALGTSLGVALGNLEVGVALGAAFGLLMHLRSAKTP